jgi:hypothetical protein
MTLNKRRTVIRAVVGVHRHAAREARSNVFDPGRVVVHWRFAS